MEPNSTPCPPVPPSPKHDNGKSTRQQIIEETIARTGKTPHDWQVDIVMDRLAGKDTLTLARTGAGKSLTFAMPSFVLPKSITWILAPLNVIEEQQVQVFSGWGVPTVCVNASTHLETTKAHILVGKYQVVISSPESFFDTNKLRPIVTSEKLRGHQHFVIVDEAHVIHSWGDAFRPAYGSVGNLRAMLYNVPFTAVTATATDLVKNTIITALHLGACQQLVVRNLGNYRKNIEHSVHIMQGGLTSFEAVAEFFPSAEQVVPTLVFTDAIANTQRIADTIRDKLGWTGDLAHRVVAYHSLREDSGKKDTIKAFHEGRCQIIVATEALTMGCDFADVRLVLRFGAPDTLLTHGQQSGRAARKDNVRARAVMMITSHQHKKALQMCSNEQDVQADDIMDVKAEEEGLGDAVGNLDIEDGILEDDPVIDNAADGDEKGAKSGGKTHTRRQKMDMDVARFIATKTCRTKVLDVAFNNPPHESCYDNRNCDLCVARRARNSAAGEEDIHQAERSVKREEIQFVMETGQDEPDPKRKQRVGGRTGVDLGRYKTHLRCWRTQTFRQEAKSRYIGLEDIMTDKALEAIAKSKDITTVAALDHLRPLWQQRGRWGQEVVEMIKREAAKDEETKRQVDAARTAAQEEAKRARENTKKQKELEIQARKDTRKVIKQMEKEARREGAMEAKRRVDKVVHQANTTQQRQDTHAPLHYANPPQLAALPCFEPAVNRPPVPIPPVILMPSMAPSDSQPPRFVHNSQASRHLFKNWYQEDDREPRGGMLGERVWGTNNATRVMQTPSIGEQPSQSDPFQGFWTQTPSAHTHKTYRVQGTTTGLSSLPASHTLAAPLMTPRNVPVVGSVR